MVAAAATGAGAALLAACSGQAGAPAGDGPYALSKAPVTLVPFLSGITDAMRGRWDEEIVAPYKQRRPNVTVELIPASGSTVQRVEKLTTMMAGGTPPDLSDGPLSARTMVQQGQLDPALDALVKRDKYDLKKYNPAHLEAAVYIEGKIWQIPYRYGGNAVCLVANKALLDMAGLPPPPADVSKAWTWEQFVTTLTRLTKLDGGEQQGHFGIASTHWMIGTWPPLWQTDWISADLKTITCDSPQMRDCYTRLAELYHRYHVAPRPGEAAQLFGSGDLFNRGKAAMAMFPPTGWRTYAGPNAQVDFVYTPLPKVQVSSPDLGTGGIGLLKGGQQQGDAWDFLKYLVEGSRYARLINLMPAVVADIEPWVREQSKTVPSADPKVILQIVDTAKGSTRISQHPRFSDMSALITPAIDDMMAGKIAPVQMLQTLKPQLQQIVGG